MPRSVDSGELVILNCAAPREKMWGILLRLDEVGAVVRGLELGAVEDWIRQHLSGAEPLLGPSTFFVPMHRVVRIDLDESSGAAEGYGDRYAAAGGGDIRLALMEETPDGSERPS